MERIAVIDRPQDRAALTQHIARERVQGQFLVVERTAHQPHRALMNSENAPAITVHGAMHDRAENGVQPGAIAAAGQYPDGFLVGHGIPRRNRPGGRHQSGRPDPALRRKRSIIDT